jgi:hypothetical protein
MPCNSGFQFGGSKSSMLFDFWQVYNMQSWQTHFVPIDSNGLTSFLWYNS